MAYMEVDKQEEAESNRNWESRNEHRDKQTVPQWTVKNLNARTVESTKRAASNAGMKINAWVEKVLAEAAARELDEGGGSELARELVKISQQISDLDKKESNFREEMQKELHLLLVGQHKILTVEEKK